MKLPRRRWLLLAACVAVVGLALAYWRSGALPSRFTREQYDRIQFGMSEAQLLKIMGEPATGLAVSGRQYWKEIDSAFYAMRTEVDPAPDRFLQWGDDQVTISAWTYRGQVVGKDLFVRVPAWWGMTKDCFNQVRRGIGF
jgi:hypothetical protein